MSEEMRESLRTASSGAVAGVREGAATVNAEASADGHGDARAEAADAADGGAWRAEDDERVVELDAKIAEVKRAHRARLKRLNAERGALVKAVEGEHMRAELERLRAENASLRARGSDARSASAPTGA